MELTVKDINIFATGVDHSECVCVHPDGSVWCGGEAGQIYRISPDGSEIKEVNNTGGFVQGLAFSPDCSWLAVCDSGNHCVWRLDMADYHLRLFADGADGERFNIPNSVVFDRQGRAYVSESGAFRKVIGKIMRFEPDGTGHIWHNGPFSFANGIALSKNEDYLYIASTWLPGVERVPINPDGTAGKSDVFATMVRTCPDGLAFDDEDNLYVACYVPNTIYKITPQQEISVLVDDWEAHTLSNPTNIAFGGKNFDKLYVANLGRWHISEVNIGVKGMKMACHK
jgi:gluconolactonase